MFYIRCGGKAIRSRAQTKSAGSASDKGVRRGHATFQQPLARRMGKFAG
jgi:hypothetical protein